MNSIGDNLFVRILDWNTFSDIVTIYTYLGLIQSNVNENLSCEVFLGEIFWDLSKPKSLGEKRKNHSFLTKIYIFNEI